LWIVVQSFKVAWVNYAGSPRSFCGDVNVLFGGGAR
jgi:hypothetical protein